MNKKNIWILILMLIILVTVEAAVATEVLVTNFPEDKVSLIDTETEEITDISVDNGPSKIALTSDSALAVVTNTLGNTASVISLEKRAVLDDVEVGEEPIGVTITPNNKFALVANSKSKSISIIDLVTLKVVKELEVGDQPIGIASSKDSTKAYVTTLGDNQITVIDLLTQEISSVFSDPELLRSPGEIKIAPSNEFAYVLDTRNNILVTVDLNTEEILDKNIQLQNININNELVLGNQFAILSASKDNKGVILIIDFDEKYASVLTEVKNSAFGIDFYDGELFIASENSLEEININTGEMKSTSFEGEITDVEILGKEMEEYTKPRKKLYSNETIKIIIIIVVILVILILIFWKKPEKKKKANSIKKSKKKKKEINKKIKKRRKTSKKKTASSSE